MSVGTILYSLLISPLRLLFEIVFSFANKLTHQPGLSIIVLSLAINLLVLPLYRRSDAMQEEERRMQAKLQRGVAHIKKVFRGDERMLMLQTYYRQNHYKPTYVLRGATSLLLEIPFFMAAYSFLSDLAILSGVSFGPIADLSRPDALLTLFGMQVNLLPIVMTLVNCVSTAIFTKDYPAKTKVQLYGMAAFFLVFLYDSPAGLVFYWTLNNVFSLVKTIFYRLKNPKRVICALASVTGLAILAVAFARFEGKNQAFLLVLGALLQGPLALKLLARSGLARPAQQVEGNYAPDRRLFLFSALFLAVLLGALIPSSVIKASPLEFISRMSFYHPLWYIVSALCLSAGSCVIWFSVFYWLASPRGRVFFERALFVLCGVAIVDYLFFGQNLGLLSPVLQYEKPMSFQPSETVINVLAVAVTAAVLYGAVRKWKRAAAEIVLVSFLAVTGMSVLNMASIGQQVEGYLQAQSEVDEDEIKIPLSKNGQNVVVLMLDRAAGHMLPYLMDEKPEMAAQYDGFTYYSNVVSYGKHTNLAAPALFGGYEYTPVEMNRRDAEQLRLKHNEALRVLPVMFLNEGSEVTVFDPPYANYSWTSDLSIYNDYPQIRKANTMGAFNGSLAEAGTLSANAEKLTRSFFCFSLMKAAPVMLQKAIYEDGNYRRMLSVEEQAEVDSFDSYPVYSAQRTDTLYAAEGLYTEFLDSYTVLMHLSDMTEITDGDEGTFLMMANDTAHSPTLLQEPDYIPAQSVDNTAYYQEDNAGRFTHDGKTMIMDNYRAIQHYHVNMAALLQLGKWFDYLRENDVYDNTRIILASDHGIEMIVFDERLELGNLPELSISIDGGEERDISCFFPLLMVKDFDAAGPLRESTEFMTNADVPALAVEGVIESPTNPFTGKRIESPEKAGRKVYVSGSAWWDVNDNCGNVFLPDQWYSVHDDLWNAENWSDEGTGVMPEGLLEGEEG